MPIRTLPLAQITHAVLLQMMEREIPEDRTLDYKQDCGLETPRTLTRAGKLSFLADVTAMANAAGGAILYGAEEGEGEARGRIAALPGLELEPDGLQLTLAQLLRDLVDERLEGVEMRAVRVSEGRYCLVVRVPASPLAPHMITLQTSASRFYVRGTVNNDPMDARQIKEVAMRSQTAVERIRQRLKARRNYLIHQLSRIPVRTDGQRLDAISVHLLPLAVGRTPDLSSDDVLRHMSSLNPWDVAEGGGLQRRIMLDGVASEGVRFDNRALRWTMLIRGGGIELVMLDRTWGENPMKIGGDDLEKLILKALVQLRSLIDASLVSLPAVLSIQLENVAGVELIRPDRRHRDGQRLFDQSPIAPEPEIISRWEDAPAAAARMLNVIWQAAGFERSGVGIIQQAAAAVLANHTGESPGTPHAEQ
jgi:hypothetical protein